VGVHRDRISRLKDYLAQDSNKVVWLLGAGASVDAGLPVMSGFFAKAREMADKRLEEHPEEKKRFDRMLKYQRLLDEDHLETCFTLLEMETQVGEISENLMSDFTYATVRTLHLCWNYQGHNRKYDKFRKIVEGILDRTSIVSLNYDLVLEKTLMGHGVPENERIKTEYYLKGAEDFNPHNIPTSGKVLPLLKLHGSANWFKCRYCEHIFIQWDKEDNWPTGAEKDSLATGGTKCPNCAHLDDRLMNFLLLPPVVSKDFGVVRSVWTEAFKKLKESDLVIFIGCSLADTDLPLRNLLKLSMCREKKKRNIFVVDKDPTVEGK